jgi:integrase/recombinase XerD
MSDEVEAMKPATPELEAFLDHLRLERALSANTCISYEQDLADFIRFLYDRGKGVLTAELADGQAYAADLRNRGLKASSAARHICTLRSFYNYLAIAAIVPDSPMALLATPRLERPLPHVLSVEDVARLIEAPDMSVPRGLRDRALWEVMYACGLRVSEAAGLEFGDLNLEDSWLLVRGKGDKERWTPLGGSAREWLMRYLNEARPLLPVRRTNSQKVFLNSRGQPLTRQGIWLLLRNQAARLSPPLNVHPHILRHCCATHMLEGGADLRMVQEFLGHADISTTQIYTHIDRNYLKEVHRTFHPRG